MRAGLWCSSLLLAVVCWTSSVAAEPRGIPTAATATALSDPSRWRFVGCSAFSADELRDALAANVDVIVMSRSSATIDKLMEVITRELTLGYRAGGYRDAFVEVDVDRDGKELVITIDEFQLFRQGKVEVRGATSIDIERLIAAVTQKSAPEQSIPVFEGTPVAGEAPLKWLMPNGRPETLKDAIWNPGQPATFVPSIWKSWEPLIQLCLKRQGYADPVVSASIAPDPDGTATLVISIREEGPRLLLGEIHVTGNERNSTEDILDYLQLKPGMPFDAMLQARLHWQLKQAARFLKHEVRLISPPFGDGPSRLELTLVEAPRVPTLKEPFSPEQLVAIRVANWMSTQREFDWEFSLRASRLKDDANQFWREFCGARAVVLRLILSPAEQASLLEASLTDRQDRLVWGQVLSVGRDSGWLLAPHHQSKLEWGRVSGTVLLSLLVSVQPPDGQGRMSNFNFGSGLNTNAAKDGRPIRDDISINPLAVVLEVTRETNKVELTDERMTIRSESFEAIFDAKTGQFLTWHLDHAGMKFEIRTDKRLYAEAANKWQTQRAASKNKLDAAALITTTLLYFTAEARGVEQLQSQSLPNWFRLAERLVNSGSLRPFDEAVAKSSNDAASPSRFWIPVEPNPKSPLGTLAWLDPMIRTVLPFYAKAFPRETPGWTIGRETALLMLQPKGVTIPSPQGVCLMLEHDQAGPLHFLLAAKSYGVFLPEHRVALAQRGLQELTPAAFRRDIAALLNERGLASHAASTLVELLQSFEEPDLNDLADVMGLAGEDRAAVTRALRELLRRQDQPASILLPELAEQTWPVLRPYLEAALNTLTTPPPRPAVRVMQQPARAAIKTESPLSSTLLPPLPRRPLTSFKPVVEQSIVPTISPRFPPLKPVGGGSR